MAVNMPGDVVRQRVLFMRHPETVSNTGHFFSGRIDVPLTPHGEEQRKRAVEALVAFSPDRVFTSPLSRARGLAEEGARLARDRAGAGRVMDEIGSVLAGVEREMNGWFGYGE